MSPVAASVLRRHFHSASRILAQTIKPGTGADRQSSHLDTYIARHTSPPQPIQALRSLRAKTVAEFPDAHKATSPEQGSFLSTLVRAAGAKRVLEVGSFTGLATLTLAFAVANNDRRGARREGKVIACETDTRAVEIARLWVKNCGMEDVVEIQVGPALETIKELDSRKKFDLIFIDANKGGYVDYFNTVMDRDLLTEDGMIIADNTLYRGLVHDPSIEADPKKGDGSEEANRNRISAGHLRTAKKMRQFNEHVCADPRVVVSVLPLFDGLTIIQKRKKYEVGLDWNGKSGVEE